MALALGGDLPFDVGLDLPGILLGQFQHLPASSEMRRFGFDTPLVLQYFPDDLAIFLAFLAESLPLARHDLCFDGIVGLWIQLKPAPPVIQVCASRDRGYLPTVVDGLGHLPGVSLFGVAQGCLGDMDGIALLSGIDLGIHGRLCFPDLLADMAVEVADGDDAVSVAVGLPGLDALEQETGIERQAFVFVFEGILAGAGGGEDGPSLAAELIVDVDPAVVLDGKAFREGAAEATVQNDHLAPRTAVLHITMHGVSGHGGGAAQFPFGGLAGVVGGEIEPARVVLDAMAGEEQQHQVVPLPFREQGLDGELGRQSSGVFEQGDIAFRESTPLRVDQDLSYGFDVPQRRREWSKGLGGVFTDPNEEGVFRHGSMESFGMGVKPRQGRGFIVRFAKMSGK